MTPKKKVENNEDLHKILIPITELRLYLSELTVAGVTEIPLDTLLIDVHRIYKETKTT